MTGPIHPSAVVEDGARIEDGVSIGPFCRVGAAVHLKQGVVLESHVVVAGHTVVGERTRIFPFAAIGLPPQDKKYAGEPSTLEIGADNVIREHVTMHPGTGGGGMVTRVGSGSLFMVGVHVAHDCQIGDDVIMANNTVLGGHVTVQDHAIIGGACAVHQFVRIGRYVMVGGMSGIDNDVIPYGSVLGNRARLVGLNLVGLKRRAFTRERIHKLRHAYRLLFAEEGTLQERLADVEAMFPDNEEVGEIIAFIRADSPRGLCLPMPERAA
jgi:UDP-N-acetylglucosamine acyltransferase